VTRRRRVLFCTLGYEPGPVGGAERQARLQADELQRRGWTVDVVTARDRGTSSGRIGAIRVRRLPAFDRRAIRTLAFPVELFVWHLANIRRYDLVHVHLANLQADATALAARLFHVPMYVKLAAGGPRGEVARMRRVAWLTRHVGVRWAGRAQATSDEIVRDLQAVGVADARIVRIPNGLADDAYRPATVTARRKLRQKLGLPEDRVLVLYAGRFAGYKGVQDLAAAWAGLERSRPASLVFVGAPAIDDPVEIPPGTDTIVHPWTDRVVEYLQACDIYAHPSHADGMPNSLLEAMAVGLACVATSVAAVPEMIEDGRSGLLVDIGDVQGLRTALGRLIDDRDLRARLGKAATREIRTTYRIASVVDRIEAAYLELLAEARA
jgi:glycosyltransferase involved in cell wall biosynthesis